MNAGSISALTLNRLSLYLRCLRNLREEGVEHVSSQELADRYRLSAPQIRKDFAQFGDFGIRGVGYEIDHVVESLNRLFGLDRSHALIIVGVGNLGSALAHYVQFSDQAFELVAAVDSDRDKIGRKVGAIQIGDSRDIPEVVERSGAEIGILTVPAEAAQANYDALVGAGIHAVLNFAPVRLRWAEGVPTKTVDLRVHLEELAFQLTHPGAIAG